jgi:NAD(P)-dependent dehydrogenase (short-subunit alcohol dehydrogenase family)
LATDLAEVPLAPCNAYLQIDLATFCQDDSYRTERIACVIESLPDGKLGALVNNAATQVVSPVEGLSVEDWTSSFHVNVLAPFLLVQGLLPALEAARGNVINICSIHAMLTKSGFAAYATSKAALAALTRSLAVELGGRVKVNSIRPAAISTPMLVDGFADNPAAMTDLLQYHPSGCIGSPEDVAKAALFLAENESPFLTGTELAFDGAISSRLHDPG